MYESGLGHEQCRTPTRISTGEPIGVTVRLQGKGGKQGVLLYFSVSRGKRLYFRNSGEIESPSPRCFRACLGILLGKCS